jgi:putative ABC transport system substrate-binding protein
MRRRDFAVLGCTAALWPFCARAQAAKLPRIGVLITANPQAFLGPFRDGLRAQGYVEGKNIQLEIRSADGKATLLPELAQELVRRKVDVIVANLTPACTVAKEATSEIPIVMAPAGAPVETGLVLSLARPGGNVTGLSTTGPEMGERLAELIRALLPAARRVAFLANAQDPFTKPYGALIERGARPRGIGIQTLPVDGVEGFESAFAAMAKDKADAVIIQPSLPRKAALDLAMKRRLPPFSTIPGFAAEGGLLTYSFAPKELHQRAAYYVDRILKGAKPADLAVEQPTRYELAINLKTAKTLGIEVPPLVLAQADEVIE